MTRLNNAFGSTESEIQENTIGFSQTCLEGRDFKNLPSRLLHAFGCFKLKIERFDSVQRAHELKEEYIGVEAK